MGNNLEIELYSDLKAVCQQARAELFKAYSYFEKIPDYNGIRILSNEICDLDNLLRGLDLYNPKNVYSIQVPNAYDRGFCDAPIVQEARDKADNAVNNAVAQKHSRMSQKIHWNNGNFYGYYCYNIYNKCLGWINYSLQKFSIRTSFNQLIIDHFESAMQYFMRFEG